MDHVVPVDVDYYRDDVYWNSYDVVNAQLNERATGDPATSWMEHLRDRYGPFEHALILNSGNGWVERSMIDLGVITSAVGVEVSADLVETARRAASDTGAAIRYVQLDTNSAAFPDEGFDLVVNHAAMHHVAYVDRVTRRICELLPPDGLYVSWDYVGPHRNQYTTRQWEAAWTANLALPSDAQQTMVYPHLPTMLACDPTEAVHSELIVPVTERYFEFEHRRDVGGGVTYLVLTHNESFGALAPEAADPLIAQIMDADAALLASDPSSTLFTYIVARPDHAALERHDDLAAWTREEDNREREAATAGGVYYPPTLVAHLTEAAAEPGPPFAAEATAEAVLAQTPGVVLARTLLLRLRVRLRLLVRALAPRRRISDREVARAPDPLRAS